MSNPSSYVQSLCDDCGTFGLNLRVTDDMCLCNNCIEIDEHAAMMEDEFAEGDDDGDLGIEDDIYPEFEDDGQPDEYTEWQDLYGGDDQFSSYDDDRDFGMDG